MNTTITITHTDALERIPTAIVRSYTRGKEILTLNLAPEAYDAETGGHLYRCTTLSIVHAGRLTAPQVLGTVYSNGLFDGITPDFLKTLTRMYSVPDYDTLAAHLIAARYTYAEELAVHRKALMGDTAPITELTAWVDRCKAMAAAAFSETETDGKQS